MAEKYYLDQEGLDRLVQYINDSLSSKANASDVPSKADLARYIDEATGYVDTEELQAALADYVTDNDFDAFRASLSTVYHFRGSVNNLEELQAIENPELGDVYNIVDTGMNAAWDGEAWDDFGSIADLSPYQLAEEVNGIAIPTVNAILYGGKSAVVSDEAGLKAMFANDEPVVTVTLNKDMTLSDNVTIAPNKKVILDLGDSTVNIPSNKELVVNGELVIGGNGEIEAAKWGINAYGEGAKVTMNSGKVSAQESPMCIQGGAKFVMNGGELEGADNCPLMGQGTAGNGGTEMIMNGGKLIAHITSAGYTACGVYMPNNGKFVMNGGEIVSDGVGLVMRAGEVELNGGSIVANGATGIKGKVGDSRVVVGPYAVVYDELAKYPGAKIGEFKLTIGENMQLAGTDGDLDVLLSEGATANIVDNRA
jgi:hypothetical protein